MAVKWVKSLDEEVRQIARDENEVMRKLSHPAIVHAEAFFECASLSWLVMELCADGDVDAFVGKHGPFQQESARQLCFQLLTGVDYLHGRRIIHRDLKPANLLLHNNAKTLKVTDFSSSKQVGSEVSKGAMLTFRGTRLYSPPEVVLGLLWNERVDIWACGLSFYYMLWSKLPFVIKSRHLAQSLVAKELPEVQWDGVSDEIRDIGKRCLTVDMQSRPSALELLSMPAFAGEIRTIASRKNYVALGHCATIGCLPSSEFKNGKAPRISSLYSSKLKLGSCTVVCSLV